MCGNRTANRFRGIGFMRPERVQTLSSRQGTRIHSNGNLKRDRCAATRRELSVGNRASSSARGFWQNMSFNRAASSTTAVAGGSSPVPINLLRKQRSCVVVDVQSETAEHHRTAVSGRLSARPTFRKQLSVDQAHLYRPHSVVAAQRIASGDSEKDLRIFAAITKRRPQIDEGIIDDKIERSQHIDDNLPTFDRRDDRINLKIYLSAASKAADGGEPSDLDSEKESASSPAKMALPSTPKLSTCDEDNKNGHPDNGSNRAPLQLSAADRRAAFQSSKSILSAATAERRPPMVRAMSAPIRPTLQDNAKTTNKRRPIRRRRIGRDRSTDGFADNNNSLIIEADDDDEDDVLDIGGATKGKHLVRRPPNAARSKSALGVSDVVTLVSLLSSGGSDSERDEAVHCSEIASSTRAPMLRKSGKSVSFQESESAKSAYPTALAVSREFPAMMMRRGSIAPLAARIRANRPPTAPPSSIFMRHEFGVSEHLELSMPDKTTICDKPLLPQDVPKLAGAVPTKADEPAITEPVYPSFCRTEKERECWTLFQKMAKKGVSVGYDTILRGMLTPTEMRAVLKQRETDTDQRNEGADEVVVAEGGPTSREEGLSPSPIVRCS